MSVRFRIIFRADGNNQIGLGHVIRSCALAAMLNKDFECHFFIKTPSQALQEEISKSCDTIHIIPPNCTINEELAKWNDILTGQEIVVLDGYHFRTSYQEYIKAKGCKLVCIDDIHDYHFLADIVINHAGGLSRNDYSVAPLTQLCLGTAYALLRKEFLDAANNKGTPETGEIFICLGGADIKNDIIDVLTFLETVGCTDKCNVILGSAYSFNDALNAFTAKSTLQIDIIRNASPAELVLLMKKCRYGICPPSTVSYEYLSVGGELYLKQTADNQKDVFAFFIDTGLAFELNKFGKVPENSIQKSLAVQSHFFDGSSGKRLKKIFNKLARESILQVRSANLGDADLFYEWVNDPEVRDAALNSDPIPYQSHTSWFSTKYDDPNVYIYVISENNVALGQVRFDVDSTNSIALIDYSLNKASRGMGLGTSILKLAAIRLIQDLGRPIYLKAVVKKENVPSVNVFENLGFTLDKESLMNGVPCNFYSQLINIDSI